MLRGSVPIRRSLRRRRLANWSGWGATGRGRGRMASPGRLQAAAARPPSRSRQRNQSNGPRVRVALPSRRACVVCHSARGLDAPGGPRRSARSSPARRSGPRRRASSRGPRASTASRPAASTPAAGSTWWAPSARRLVDRRAVRDRRGLLHRRRRARVRRRGGRHDADAITFFVGSIFFTTAALLQYLQTRQRAARASVARIPSERLRFWTWEPGRIDWTASAVQLVGTVFFNVTTLAAIDASSRRDPGAPAGLGARRRRVDLLPRGQRARVVRGEPRLVVVAAAQPRRGGSPALNLARVDRVRRVGGRRR